ncbi:pyroglutamyl-peptidase I family protein [Roseibium limicola]|uniref:pyroglutamyl-peptidase I family protein n=1 Tax=Roseibium limicola TaxID=2816037 RepID=UPI001AD8C411|nr:hypothetical protein [Roseibium limicola]
MEKSVLVTGFSPFPGMPVNPTALLIERLKHRLPHYRQSVTFRYERLPTTWAGREDVTAPLRHKVKPDAIVHFGVDGSRPQINIETRAVNRATCLKPDAAGAMPVSPKLDAEGPDERFSTLAALPLRNAMRATGVPADLSRDAGAYLCNATLWDSIGSGIPTIFVHVPSISHGKRDPRLCLASLEEAGIALLRDLARRL